MAKRALHASDTQFAKHIAQSALHAHRGADIFFPRKHFTAASEGVDDAGKGVLLNALGLIDSSMISGAITGIQSNPGSGEYEVKYIRLDSNKKMVVVYDETPIP